MASKNRIEIGLQDFWNGDIIVTEDVEAEEAETLKRHSAGYNAAFVAQPGTDQEEYNFSNTQC